MFDLNGKYTTARIFTNNVENEALSQIYELCNQEFVKGCKVRIMPDVHAGKGCTIGTTMEIKDKVVPNLVGVDISCGVLCVKLKEKEIDFQKLDDIIRKYIPSGMNIREKAIDSSEIRKIGLQKLKCVNNISMDRAEKSLGSLGGGNHYCEVDKDDENNIVNNGKLNVSDQNIEENIFNDTNYDKTIPENNVVPENNVPKQYGSVEASTSGIIAAILDLLITFFTAWQSVDDEPIVEPLDNNTSNEEEFDDFKTEEQENKETIFSKFKRKSKKSKK